MSTIKWRKFPEEKPTDEQSCLTECKHGLIQGCYNEKKGYFEGYYWVDISWHANLWVPIEEVQP